MISSRCFRSACILALMIITFELVFVGTTEARDEKRDADKQEIVELSQRWRTAVASRDPALVEVVSSPSKAHYRELKHAALHADSDTLRRLPPTDQLQALFFRLMLEPGELDSMSAGELILFAVKEGMIGVDLRKTDELRELSIQGEFAQGRLYKFGLDERPDRGLQYFEYEQGQWRINLRGELERLENDFNAFVSRSKIPPGEASFFILEARLFRKVTPEDFIPPLAGEEGRIPASGSPRGEPREDPVLRVVSIRQSLDDVSQNALTIQSARDFLHYILKVGEALPPDPRFVLVRIEGGEAELKAGEESLILRLGEEGGPLRQPLRRSSGLSGTDSVSMLELAELGADREGLMAQWRNVGLRGRPQLLQQVWFNPAYSPEGTMSGLKVRHLVEGSFWHQIGLKEADLLTVFNGKAVDSTLAWREVLSAAGTELNITIEVERGDRTMRFETRTIRPF